MTGWLALPPHQKRITNCEAERERKGDKSNRRSHPLPLQKSFLVMAGTMHFLFKRETVYQVDSRATRRPLFIEPTELQLIKVRYFKKKKKNVSVA